MPINFIENTDNVEQTTAEAVLTLQKPMHYEHYDTDENPAGYVLLSIDKTKTRSGEPANELKLHTNMPLNAAARFILMVLKRLIKDLAKAGIEV